ncbi:MAG TPA: hypothetical protein PKV33_03470 [Methanothrix sp.]|nr:hypothetical protein [Methanothrix sp.]
MADESENDKAQPAENAGRFWQMLMEMDENDECQRPFSGSLEYSGFIRAIYHGRVQIGFENEKA